MRLAARDRVASWPPTLRARPPMKPAPEGVKATMVVKLQEVRVRFREPRYAVVYEQLGPKLVPGARGRGGKGGVR